MTYIIANNPLVCSSTGPPTDFIYLLKMGKVFMYIQLIVCVLELGSTSEDITVGPNTCYDNYYLDDINEAYLTYNGAALETEECYKLYTCTNATDEEWCGLGRTYTVYIVYRTNGGASDTSFKIRVSLKTLPKEKDPWETDSEESSSLTVALVFPIVLVICIIVTVIALALVYKKRQHARRPQYLGRNNTPVAQQVPMQPMYRQQQQQMQQQLPQPPGNYQMHPMQTAYPVHAQHADTPLADIPHQTGGPMVYNQEQLSAPYDGNMDPPPYSSVVH